MNTIQHAAEQVLFGSSLNEKLWLAPAGALDRPFRPGKPCPAVPGRPPGLEIAPARSRDRVNREAFPGIDRIEDDTQRGKLLHFLANHELLAAELMALALLKFPNAPAEYRAGVFAAMREEQIHTRLYLHRMRECGVEFGELPLSGYFWRIVSTANSPLDFVTRLNLTFEQANLDFSKFYATRFHQAGDPASARVLEKIHRDEIGHVGHGLKWFREWKTHGHDDWRAYRSQVPRHPGAARAKGLAPFNADSRRIAGFDENFIQNLAVCEESRGRTPVVHHFNPGAEDFAAAAILRRSHTPDRAQSALQHDLDLLPLAWARRDDLVLVRSAPSPAHLARLKAFGFDLPAFSTSPPPAEMKLGGLRPWAWSPDAIRRFEPLAGSLAPNLPWPWMGKTPPQWFSKISGHQLERDLGIAIPDPAPQWCEDFATAESALERCLTHGPAMLKAAFSCAGKCNLRIAPDHDLERTRAWITRTLRRHGGLLVEPWLDRILDFSALYDFSSSRPPKCLGISIMENDADGRFTGSRVARRWSSLVDPALARFMIADAALDTLFGEIMPPLLARHFAGHVGALGVDAMVHQLPDGSLSLRPVVEVNPRMSMGRVALELLAKSPPRHNGRFRILRKHSFTADEAAQLTLPRADRILLTDPSHATWFLAEWSIEPIHR